MEAVRQGLDAPGDVPALFGEAYNRDDMREAIAAWWRFYMARWALAFVLDGRALAVGPWTRSSCDLAIWLAARSMARGSDGDGW